MTNEKAREILQQIRKQKCVSECDYGCKLYESETFCLEEKALDMAIKALEQTPPKGKWSRPSVVTMPYSFAYECPICRQWGNIQTFKPNYCPNCGADMRGEEE